MGGGEQQSACACACAFSLKVALKNSTVEIRLTCSILMAPVIEGDDSYISKQSPNGKGVFWSRANGWAIAALARTIEALPASRTSDREE